MMFPIDYNGDVLNHNARVGVDGGIVESTDFLADFSEQTKRVNMPLLLDIYPNAAAAYSLRKLRTAYTGSAIRVRRSSDNTETDIGFNNAGGLDTSALATFVGNGNGFVTRWYDQSGSNRHATQTTQADQPQIVNTGTIFYRNSKPTIRFNGTSNWFNTTLNNPFSFTGGVSLIHLSYKDATTFKLYETILSAGTTGDGLSNVEKTLALGYNNSSSANPIPTISTDIWKPSGIQYNGTVNLNSTHLVGYYISNWSLHRNTGSSIITFNGNDIPTKTYNTFVPQGLNTNPIKIGVYDTILATSFFAGEIQEIIAYPTNQSPNRIGIETNINSYYRIYQQEALLLDYYPDAAAAYSLRKLRSGYTGAAIQVRRSSDNAVQNIGFDSNGGLDTTALTTFVGAGNTGFVTTWYDQSGNNRNATQTGTTAQPVIFSGGTVISENNKPSLRFNNSSKYYVDFSLTSPVSTWVVGKKYDNNVDFFIDGRTKNNSNSLITLDATTLRMYDTTGITHTITPYTWLNLNLIFGISNSSSSLVGLNNSFTTGSQPSVNMGGLTIGTAALNDANILNGSISEIIVYQLNQNSNLLNINSNINSYYNIYPTDSDANAFVTAAALTNTTQIQAVNKLVTDLKGYGLWGKMKAIYPFVGGTAASHKFNLKDPRDVDGAFRLVFSGGWTHSATGAKPDGSTGYADTKFTPSLNYISNVNVSMGFYSRTNTCERGNDIGVYQNSSQALALQTRWDNCQLYSQCYADNSTDGIILANSSSLGLFISSRISLNSFKVYRNGVILGSKATLNGTIPNQNIVLSSYGSTLNSGYSTREQAFAFIGDGLTDTEAANLYSAVQTFQTTLGRQV